VLAPPPPYHLIAIPPPAWRRDIPLFFSACAGREGLLKNCQTSWFWEKLPPLSLSFVLSFRPFPAGREITLPTPRERRLSLNSYLPFYVKRSFSPVPLCLGSVQPLDCSSAMFFHSRFPTNHLPPRALFSPPSQDFSPVLFRSRKNLSAFVAGFVSPFPTRFSVRGGSTETHDFSFLQVDA